MQYSVWFSDLLGYIISTWEGVHYYEGYNQYCGGVQSSNVEALRGRIPMVFFNSTEYLNILY